MVACSGPADFYRICLYTFICSSFFSYVVRILSKGHSREFIFSQLSYTMKLICLFQMSQMSSMTSDTIFLPVTREIPYETHT